MPIKNQLKAKMIITLLNSVMIANILHLLTSEVQEAITGQDLQSIRTTCIYLEKLNHWIFPQRKRVIQKEYDNSAPPDSSNRYIVGDITITALSLNLDKIQYSTYLGGSSMDFIKSCSFGLDGDVILAGQTYSDNFPVTKNAYQKSRVGKEDGFLTILNQSLSKIKYSTFIGGDSTDQVNYVFMEDADNIILAGQTKSPDFPVTSDAINQKYIGGNADGFIMKFNLKLISRYIHLS